MHRSDNVLCKYAVNNVNNMQNSGNGFVHTSRRLLKRDHRGKGWFSGPRFLCALRGAAALFEFLKLFCDADVSIFLNKTGSGAHRWQAGFNLWL